MRNLECCNCGVVFGITDNLYTKRLSDGKNFYCSNGHSQAFQNSGEDMMRRERDRAIQEKARLEEELAKASKEMERVTKRTMHGICPCCNRTFSNVARHMKTKHPEIVKFPKKKAS